MSDGIAEMNKAKIYTHTDGVKYNVVASEGVDDCTGCAFQNDLNGCESGTGAVLQLCGRECILKLQSPLATASAELAEKGMPLVSDSECMPGTIPDVRTFDTGATRDSDEGKYDIEAFFNPIVTQRRSEYMHKHRKQSDGAMRDGDNWQSGMPYRESLKSLCRHMEDVKLISRGYEVFEKDKHGEFKLKDSEKIPVTIQDAICAAQFNLDSMLLTRLTEK